MINDKSLRDSLIPTNAIRDVIIGHIESLEIYERGMIPQSVISAVENAALRVVRSIEFDEKARETV